MALNKKDYITIYGVEATHWVIQAININSIQGYADITLNGFKDILAYENGFSPIETRKSKISSHNGFDEFFGKKALTKDIKNKNIYELAYEYLKTHTEFFKGSIDC